jgi:NTE family protein
VRDRITHAHLLASSAIPFIFPAVPLEVEGHLEYFGDGSMRQSAPVAAAIHLGAERILVIGAGRMTESPKDAEHPAAHRPPSLAQIAGHALSNIFLDALAVDIERARRINQTLTFIPPEARGSSALRPIEMLVIAPSQHLDGLAARHISALPPAVRTLLAAIGVSSNVADAKGAALASYLLFEGAYTRALMALGYQDAYAQENEVMAFFGWADNPDPLQADTPRAWA